MSQNLIYSFAKSLKSFLMMACTIGNGVRPPTFMVDDALTDCRGLSSAVRDSNVQRPLESGRLESQAVRSAISRGC